MNEQHVVLPGSARPAKAGAERVGPADPNTQVEITVTLRAPQLPDADHLPAQPMTREELAAQYGASQEDADKAAAAFQRFGLKVEDVSLLTHSMRLSGTLQDVQAAFKPNLAIYQDAKQGAFRGRTGELQIPADVQGIVTGVFGLDERRVAKRGAGTDVDTAAAAAGPGLAALTPADLEQRYNFPPGNGAGQQIGIAEFEGGYFASDLQAFCQKYGRLMPQVTTVPLGIPAYTLAQIQKLPASQRQEELDASVEVMMDIQIIAGLCPQAEIFVYFAPFTEQGWVDLLNQVVKGTPAQPVSLSISWGLAEDAPDWSAGAIQAINQGLNACAALGITVCISSGDDGSGDQLDDGRAHVNFPASSPFVLSVGGTMLAKAGAKVDEVTWYQAPGTRAGGGGATGGGVSVLFPRPSWQTVQVASVNHGSIDGRVLPDIAALSGPPFYDLIFLGKDQPNGGTSASAPLWAALIARINAGLAANKQHRFLTPLLYQKGPNGKTLGQLACRDITQGNNASHPQPGAGYAAGPGYDAVTGWGVPDGVLLLNSL